MKFRRLLAQSKTQLAAQPPVVSQYISFRVFESGAHWMAEKMNVQHSGNVTSFSAYGALKYGVSGVFFVASALLLGSINLWLLPLSVVIFYLAEVHFLFLFPLLIDKVKRPVWTSVKQTYRTGLLASLLNVIPIGLFMLLGLLRRKDPLRNWYIGCLAIVIWYKDEVRGRL
jgi:hypothetical protein